MDDSINNLKISLPPHIQLIDVDDTHLLLSNDRYPLTIIDIPRTVNLPSIEEIESRFEQLNYDSLNTDPLNTDPLNLEPDSGNDFYRSDGDGERLFPTDNAFGPVKPKGDWYFSPESSVFSTEHILNHPPSKGTIDRVRFPPGARIYPMSPVNPKNIMGGNRRIPRVFYTMDPDSDPDPIPKYPFDDRDL